VLASAPQVIVSEWLDGVPLGDLIAHPAAGPAEQSLRDRYARTIVETMFATPERLGMLHADPHPGNFLVLTDGRLGMVDFGAVAMLPEGIPPVLARILRHVADGEADRMMDLMRAERFIGRDVPA
jgi:predicted unusual protein kinase regulating ubiquinone biosynthesis (AarF/ABC1/UbiB family)